MSITSITIENFKGIRDRVTIDLKPITLLFGPNSAGKSTIIQALHYAWEVIGRHNLDPNFTEFGGREMDLGGFENLVYGHNLNRSISIRLDMDMKGKGLPTYGNDEKRAFDETVFYGCGANSSYDDNLIITYWECQKEIINAWIETQISWCEQSKNFQVSGYDVGLNNELIAKVRSIPESDKVNITYINFFHPLLVSINSDLEKNNDSITVDRLHGNGSFLLDRLKELIEEIGIDPDKWMDKNFFSVEQNNKFIEISKQFPTFLEENRSLLGELLEKTKTLPDKDDTQYKEKFDEIKNEFLERYMLFDDDIYAPFLPYAFLFFCFEAFGIQSINDELKIECTGLKDALPGWETPFRLNFKSDASEYYADALESAILQFIVGPTQLIKSELQKLSYLGPIRSRIPRNYVPNRYVEKRNWPDGLAAWDVLHKEEEEIVKQVDFWMADRLKSGYHITRKTYKEIDVFRVGDEKPDLQAIYNAAPAKTRLFLMDQKSGVEVQPPDVGVGISQVIPVIVSCLYFKEGIVSIEQPELHIHPALQVTLGDLFISQIQEKGPCFILETHSEHLMLRFLRRIRETSEGNLSADNSALTPDQLAIYYIEPGENGMTVSRIRVDQDGEFMDRWPHGFFNERVEELY